MFKFQGKFHKFGFSFDIESVITPYLELACSLDPRYIETKKLYTIDDDFAKEYQDRKQSFKGDHENDFFEDAKERLRAIIAGELLSSILDKENLSRSISKVALLCFSLNKKYYIIGDSTYNILRGKLISMFKSNKLLDRFLNLIGIKDNHDFLINSNLYDEIVPKEENCESSDMDSLIYPISIINTTNLDKDEESDFKMLWVNYERLSKDYDLNEKDAKVFIPLFQNGELFGIKIGNSRVMPVQRILDDSLILDVRTKLWIDIENLVYYSGDSSKERISRKAKLDEKKFLDSAKKDDLTNILSKLKYNLYLDEVAVSGYEDFFVPLTLSKNVKGLQNFQFLIENTPSQGPFFAAYQNVKDYKDKDFNLRHYAEKVGDNKVRVINGDNNVRSQEQKIVSALKPDYAFYYLSYFYEDFFNMSLRELKNSFNGLHFVTNYKIEIQGHPYEIDDIVYYKGEVYIIELKTNLGFENINAFREKCIDLYKSLSEFKDHIHFYIIGAFAKGEVDMLNKDINMPDYNKARNGLDCIPYAFCVPIPNGSYLYGFCESSYEQLKRSLTSIFKLQK